MKTRKDLISRRLAVVLKDANDAITVHDLEGNILAWNMGAEKMYGFTETQALRMNIEQITPSDKRSETNDYLKRIASGEVVDSFETQRITHDGRLLDVWLVITCLKDNSGKIDSIATTERDITEMKDELRRKSTEVKSLMGLLPICSSCKQIRDGEGNWHQLETYISRHSDVDFSHGICPECFEKIYPELKLCQKMEQKGRQEKKGLQEGQEGI